MYCTQCGKNNLDNAKFCIGCGAELSNVKTVNSNPDNNISQGIQPNSIEMASPAGISGQSDIKPKKNIYNQSGSSPSSSISIVVPTIGLSELVSPMK